ncbi:glutamine--tRNA ligase/YqeY domain fusion protein [Acetivibrio saccincola]|jgi:glutaminyl-tRNA synthetase|uniref:Glutamine--tRNA ligase n=1 Tax=Acetivibrio saccincola TaxID=1677857 RepID=A0A2K9EBC0_9FIRM|nr:glutamine--tRNA ligase/YqeY domain fusion protein [Acetivibrio saccincola]AUG57454.1 Glutamine--tRNA ligase [Acetivibrio saccincola]NLW27360.1 glutamine--tRNA ligase/YqeY domain fusion protein [Acetivibrio saccincola]PQQ67376.1 glutamine--tRNA ligase [Acetivibrio saccincola]HOA98158.1 glutamine--tRNA ligase/YqeY domain fusion protein [Acetivibrio saccincola]HQD29402.1 glutamine--tRNA ligase/YqeY domain fusion protein [Acetivibrio saccincola]
MTNKENNNLDTSEKKEKISNFIQDIIDKDTEENRYGKRVHTRFPPEPNGYLHIGHAKSICLNYGIAVYNNGKFNLRFDDTNPSKEEVEYVESIIEDVKWLGADWEDRLYYASDYFDRFYECAVQLIKMGKAYVCDLSPEEIREYRGTLTEPGKNSPYRDRSVEENLDLFTRMKNGEFEEGSKVLRAKIDMASPNLNMRDPVIYRIMKVEHHRTGNKWCIYPMYDFAHPLSDSFEGITHSICTLEFEDHRPLYNWFLETLDLECKSRQIEFARLNLTHTVMSKRKLLRLVKEGYVNGWDDPRMPTISGLRRRGYTPSSIREFCSRIGVAKNNSMVDIALLEHCIREELNAKAKRVMAVLDPLKVVIDNYPEDLVEEFEVTNNPEDPEAGKRKVPFSKVVYIERDDFCENPPKKYFRLAPGREVRLMGAYFIKCTDVVKDENTGEILEVHCTYDPESRGGNSPDGRKVRGTIHWVSEKHAVEAEVRLYDHLFSVPDPDSYKDGDFTDLINPDSLKVLKSCKLEPGLKDAKPGDMFQFIRLGYFCVDRVDSTEDAPVFNRTVSLKDTWSKIANKEA